MKDQSNHRTATALRRVGLCSPPAFWFALGVVLAAGCGSSSATESNSGVTNWLRCTEKTDCDGHPQATCSADGYCLDSDGRRIAADAPSDPGTDPAGDTDVTSDEDASTGATDSPTDDTCEADSTLDDTCDDAIAMRALVCPGSVDLPPTCIPSELVGDTRVWCCPANTALDSPTDAVGDAGQSSDPDATDEPSDPAETDGATASTDDPADTDNLPNDPVDAGTSDEPAAMDAGADVDDEPDASGGSSEPQDPTPGTDANAACLYLDEAGQIQLEVLNDCLCPGWLSCDVTLEGTTVIASATTTPTDVVCPPACYVARDTCDVDLDADAGVLWYGGVELPFTRDNLPAEPPEAGPAGAWVGACITL